MQASLSQGTKGSPENKHSNKLLSEETIRAFKSGNCFDFIRYFFAFSLFIVHFCVICDIEQFWVVSGGMRVKAFFTLSGFLVFYSFTSKNNLKRYLLKRVRRIMPAYTAAIVLCFIVGLLFTTLPLSDFLRSGATWKYLLSNLSFLNFLQPTLPGTFSDNPLPYLNGSLWSMKVEVFFYLSVPVVFWLMTKVNKHLVLFAVYLLCFVYGSCLDYLYAQSHNPTYLHMSLQAGSFIYFYAGVIVLLYFDRFMRYRIFIIPVAAIIWFLCGEYSSLHILEALSFACLLVGFAYSVRRLNFLRRYDNISYGIYLYHYPIIQSLVALGVARWNIHLTFLISFLITLLLANISWRFLEKRFLTFH